MNHSDWTYHIIDNQSFCVSSPYDNYVLDTGECAENCNYKSNSFTHYYLLDHKCYQQCPQGSYLIGNFLCENNYNNGQKNSYQIRDRTFSIEFRRNLTIVLNNYVDLTPMITSSDEVHFKFSTDDESIAKGVSTFNSKLISYNYLWHLL